MVQPGSSATQALDNLGPRPPTPPRESDNKEPTLSVKYSISERFQARTPPNQSPSSSAEQTEIVSGKQHKKVEWSPWTEYKDAPKISNKNGSPSQQGHLRPLPPSGGKPVKSILKPYNGIIAVDHSQSASKLLPPHTFTSFATMLESIVKQLAGSDRSSRLDAYLTLSGVLKAAENIPDPVALKEKMGLMSQFIQRDITARLPSGALDTQIINNSLITVATLLWRQGSHDLFPTDFCGFFMDHAISALEGSTVPKDVVKHLMFILGQQNFPAKVMTPERTTRLILALQEVEQHVKGRSIILGRLNIYRKLLKQAKHSMLSTVDWVEHLFTDMLSNFKDLREAAISFGFEASLALGTEKQVSRAVMELLKIEKDDGTKYATYFSGRLSSMVRKKQNGSSVPQIWSIVILFLRYRPHQIEHWEFMRPWLQIIQECFNNSDHDVKVQANMAWNRLVFAIRPDESTSSTMVKMLGQPLSGQLKRKLVGKNSRISRQTTFESICNLLYYTLKPTASAAQLDMYWDENVVQLISNSLVSKEHTDIESARGDLNQACAIFQSLFDTSKSTVWHETRAMDGGPIGVTELPSIDARWVRRNAPRMFTALVPLIEKCYWDLSNPGSPILLVWQNFASCIASAGAKEIKVSNDTMVTMASTYNMLCTLWYKGPRNIKSIETGGSIQFLKGFEALVSAMVCSLGILPFTEKLLSISQQDTFVVVATPSHRPSKPAGDVKCPLHHLVTLMAKPSSDLKCDEIFYQTVRLIVRPFFEGRKSKWPRIELARDLVLLLKLDPKSSASVILWQIFADAATAALKHNDPGNSSSGGSLDQPLGAEYRNLVKVLEHGVSFSPEEPLPEWKELFIEACSQITGDAGDGGRAISIIEPLARILQQTDTNSQQMVGTAYCLLVVDQAVYPRERNVLDAARRRLWGAVNTGPKSASLDPFVHLYSLVDRSLLDSYKSMTNDSLEPCAMLLTSATRLIKRCPTEYVVHLLSKFQTGASLWISDVDSRLAGQTVSSVFTAVSSFWATICSTISSLPQTDNTVLHILNQLVCSGLQSKYRGIVVATVNLWNGTFGREIQLDYSAPLQVALTRIRSVADLQLPSFPSSLDSEVFDTVPSFFDDSQDDESIISSPANISSMRSRDRSSYLGPLSKLRSSPRIEVPQSVPRKRLHGGTPEPSRRKISKGNLTPKFKHNDSQIEFAAIESSPLADAVLDSQLLTDRQREVKERQQAESVLFPILRSSPRVRTKSGFAKLHVNSDLPLPELASIAHPTTPEILSRNKDAFDNYINSSPTPRRGSATTGMDSDAIEPPSSPPERVTEEISHEVSGTSDLSKEAINKEPRELWEVSISIPEILNEGGLVYDYPEIDQNQPLQGPSVKAIEELCKIQTVSSAVVRPATPTTSRTSVSIDQRTPKTPMDIFVDALSSPAPPSPYKGPVSNVVHQASAGIPQGDHSRAVSGLGEDSQISYRKNSSPLSDLDESSMVRLLSEIDGLDNAAAAQILQEAAGHSSLPNALDTTDDVVTLDRVPVDMASTSDVIQVNESSDVSDYITVATKREPKSKKPARFGAKQSELEGDLIKPTRFSPRHTSRLSSRSTKILETPAKVSTDASIHMAEDEISEINTQLDAYTSGSSKESSKRRRTSTRLHGVEVSDSAKKRKLAEAGAGEVPDSQGAASAENREQTPKIDSAPSSAVCSIRKVGRPRKSPKKAYPRRRTRSSQSFEGEMPEASVSEFSEDISKVMTEDRGLEEITNQNKSTVPLDQPASSAKQNDEEVKIPINSEPIEYQQSSMEGSTYNLASSGNSRIKAQEQALDTSFLSGAQIVDQSFDVFVEASIDDAGQTMTKESGVEGRGEVTVSERQDGQANPSGTTIIQQFRNLIASLKELPLTRGDAAAVDDLMWDLKREVCDAEQRGRRMSREGSDGAGRD